MARRVVKHAKMYLQESQRLRITSDLWSKLAALPASFWPFADYLVTRRRFQAPLGHPFR